MKGFKHGCLLGMIIVLGIAGWIWYTPNVWQQYWKECMLLCIFGVITGSVYYEVMLFKQREHRLQKEEEQRLLLQQKRYQLVLDNSDEMMYEIGICEASDIISDRVYEKFGWRIPKQSKNLDAQILMKIWHVVSEDEPQVRLLYDRITKQGRSGRIVVRMQKSDGEFLWCAVTGFPLYDAQQQLVSIVGKIEDVDRETKIRKQLEQESRTDSMTGLVNKSAFATETIRYLRQNTAMNTAIIFIDMDYFKEVNDTMGHSMGDHVICDMAQKLQIIFANYDLVARFGGDEFCVFVKDIPYDTLKSKLEWTVDKLHCIYTSADKCIEVTASIGAAYCTQKGSDYQVLLDTADAALYEAKKKGRNQYIIKNIVGALRVGDKMYAAKK